jgi:two-component system alkaline phosphatase synthesis response regulator PhoP
LAKGLRLNLTAEGYRVTWAVDGKAGLQKALAESPDLILLDIMMPGMDGWEVCRELRKKGVRAPIVILTVKSDEVDKVVGLEMGADDYVTKPFGLRELKARIRAHLRRAKEGPVIPLSKYRFGAVDIDFVKMRIERKTVSFDLTSLEAAILKFFIAHRGEVVTRDLLLDKIWGYEKFPTTRTIDNHILKLRKKIEADPSRPEFLLSVYGEGYRFLG